MASNLLKKAQFNGNLYLMLMDCGFTFEMFFCDYSPSGIFHQISKSKVYCRGCYKMACDDFYKSVEIHEAVITRDNDVRENPYEEENC